MTHHVAVPVFALVLGMVITAADISSFIKEIVPLVTAMGVVYGIYVASRVKAASATVIAQQAAVKEDTAATLGHVNSAASKAQSTIDALLEKIALMDKAAAENKEIAAQLAKSVELAAAYAVVPKTEATPKTEAATPHLQAIETNTAATADNTKRTDAVVQELKDK